MKINYNVNNIDIISKLIENIDTKAKGFDFGSLHSKYIEMYADICKELIDERPINADIQFQRQLINNVIAELEAVRDSIGKEE